MAQYGIFQYGSDQYGLGQPIVFGSSPFISHEFNLNEILGRVTSKTTLRNVFNQFDEHGLIVGLNRLQGETNWEFKRRILDVFVHRANSSYRGLINGITRELGLELFFPIIINPKINLTDGSFFAPDPYIQFDGVWLYLYSDYRNNVLDFKIDRFMPGGNFELLRRLVDFVNKTTFFEAGLIADNYENLRSMTLVNQSNRIRIIGESVVPTTKVKLKNERIVPGSITSNDFTVFRKEVNNMSLLTTPGTYYVNYRKGIITFSQIPSIGTSIDYSYNVYPFIPLASPVILHDINNDNFKVEMFEQVVKQDGIIVNGLPTELGVDIINELMTVYPMYWGI